MYILLDVFNIRYQDWLPHYMLISIIIFYFLHVLIYKNEGIIINSFKKIYYLALPGFFQTIDILILFYFLFEGSLTSENFYNSIFELIVAALYFALFQILFIFTFTLFGNRVGISQFSFISTSIIVIAICVFPPTGAALTRKAITNSFFQNGSCSELILNNRYVDFVDPELMIGTKDGKTKIVSIILNNDDTYYVRKTSDPIIYRIPSNLVMSLTKETCPKEASTDFKSSSTALKKDNTMQNSKKISN